MWHAPRAHPTISPTTHPMSLHLAPAAGTVDALLCSKDAGDSLRRMFSEVSRVLVPGGVFLLVTLGAPAHRLALVNKPEFGWDVQVGGGGAGVGLAWDG